MCVSLRRSLIKWMLLRAERRWKGGKNGLVQSPRPARTRTVCVSDPQEAGLRVHKAVHLVIRHFRSLRLWMWKKLPARNVLFLWQSWISLLKLYNKLNTTECLSCGRRLVQRTAVICISTVILVFMSLIYGALVASSQNFQTIKSYIRLQNKFKPTYTSKMILILTG